MSTPCKSRSDEVMERIWAAMRGNYGARWDRMFPVPPVPPGFDEGRHAYEHAKSVQGIWAAKLSRFASNIKAIAFALENLPAEPPNLPEFVALCNRRPDEPMLALPAPEVNQVLAAEVLAKASAAMRPSRDILGRQREHMAQEIAGIRPSARQREFWRIALRAEILSLHGIDTAQKFDLAELGRLVAARSQNMAAARQQREAQAA